LITTKTMNFGMKAAQNYDPSFNPFHDRMEIHYVDNFGEIPVIMDKNNIKILLSNILLAFSSSENNDGSALLKSLKERGVKFFYLESTHDAICVLPEILSFDCFRLVDGFFCLSEYWKEGIVSALKRKFKLTDSEIMELSKKFYVVGWPELDSVEKLDKKAILEKYRLTNIKKMIVFFDPVGNVNYVPNFFYKYYFRIFGSKKEKILRFLKNLLIDMYSSPKIFWKLPFYLKAYLTYRKIPNYQELFFSLKKFCQDNDYLLICKSREKNNDPDFIKTGCDLYTYDRGYLPFTLLELMCISDVYVGFNSSSIMEAVYCKLPVLSIHVFPMRYQFSDYRGNIYEYLEECFNSPGEFLNFPGVNRVFFLYKQKIDFKEAFKGLKLDPQRRDDYVAKFIGFMDGKSSNRILNILEENFLS